MKLLDTTGAAVIFYASSTTVGPTLVQLSPLEEGRPRMIPCNVMKASFAHRDTQCGSVHAWQLAWLSLVLGLNKYKRYVMSWAAPC